MNLPAFQVFKTIQSICSSLNPGNNYVFLRQSRQTTQNKNVTI